MTENDPRLNHWFHSYCFGIVVHLILHAIALHRMQILVQIGTSGIYAAFQMIKMPCTRYEVL